MSDPTKSPFPLSPTGIAHSAACLHMWHLNCFGDKALKREPDEGTRLMFQRGIDEEERKVKTLPGLVEVVWTGRDWAEGVRKTLDVMRAGPAWIYQGVLAAEDGRGRPDLLRRIERPSALGAHSYEPVDVKGHKEVKASDRLQLQAYAWLLESLLGYRPERGAIWLNTGEFEEVDLAKTWGDFEEQVAAMRRVAKGAEATHGLRCGECKLCPWLDVCANKWKEDADVCLIYGVTQGPANKLRKAGFATWPAVAASGLEDFVSRSGLKEKAARATWLFAQAWKSRKPVRFKPATFPDDRPRFFYDVETFEKTVYLHGVIRVEGDKREERQWVAEDPADEGRIWREFLEYLGREKNAIVYCWSEYEFGTTETLSEKYPGESPGLRLLNATLTDQCAWTRERFALPVSSYSIKKVAPTFGFEWDAEDAGGLNSESWYKTWLETRERAVLEKLVRYNLDDVRAMEAIDVALRRWSEQNPEGKARS